MIIAIGIPCMGTIRVETVGSLIQMQRSYPDIDFRWMMVGNSLVYDARNELLNHAKREQADYLLFIDSDIQFPCTALSTLINLQKGVVTGVYMSRSEEAQEPVIYTDLKPRSIFNRNASRKPFTGQINGVTRVDGCGMGFCLIRRDVIDKITKRFVSPFEPFRGLGEDLSFCYRLAKIREPIYAVNCGLEHIGTKHYK